MARASEATKLEVRARTSDGSRAVRRLRREGRVPGVLYGGDKDCVSFDVDSRELRHALHASGAVLEIAVDGETSPAILKHTQRDPVRGETLHVDLLRVRLDQKIQASVPLHLLNAEESPGVKEGGVLDQITHELSIEALPTEIPEAIEYDVSSMEMNDTLFLSVVSAPAGVTLLDDPVETAIASLNPPRVEEEPEEIEEETELIGEDGEPIERPEGEEGEGAPEGESSGDAGQSGGRSADSGGDSGDSGGE